MLAGREPAGLLPIPSCDGRRSPLTTPPSPSSTPSWALCSKPWTGSPCGLDHRGSLPGPRLPPRGAPRAVAQGHALRGGAPRAADHRGSRAGQAWRRQPLHGRAARRLSDARGRGRASRRCPTSTARASDRCSKTRKATVRRRPTRCREGASAHDGGQPA